MGYSIETCEACLPCPHCGDNNIYLEHYEHHAGQYRWRAICPYPGCGASVDAGTWQSKQEAIDAWNRRAS